MHLLPSRCVASLALVLATAWALKSAVGATAVSADLGGYRIQLAGSDDVPDLHGVEIGSSGPGVVLEQKGRVLELTGRGKGDFNHDDTGSGFAFIDTEAQAFTLVARVAKAPPRMANTTYGIALRSGDGPFDRMIAARRAGGKDGRIDWLLRYTPAKSTHDGSARLCQSGRHAEMDVTEGFWLKLVRRYPTVGLFHSTDGQEWRRIAPDYHLALLEQKVKVGLMLTAGGNGEAPATVTFDHVSFTEDEVPAFSRTGFAEYRGARQSWQMFLIQADTARYGPDSQAFFILKPRALEWKDVRAALYTTGDKEILLDDGTSMVFENGPHKRRRPKGMADWEGAWEIDNLSPRYRILAHYGIVRLASPGRFEPLDGALAEMAERFQAPQIVHLPVFTTGASACGGQAAQAANSMPGRTIGSCPVLIGAAAADMDNAEALESPRLYTYGSRDSGRTHHRQLVELDSTFREHGALWGAAPMWGGYHRWWYADRLMLPYLTALVELRVPSDADPAAGPVKLTPLKEEDGYLGLNDTWETRFPKAVAWKDATEAQRRGNSSWLPDALTARTWQCFVSNGPRTVIHFPRHDGSGGIRDSRHPGRENHYLPANEPWRLLASGPLGGDVAVEYYAGLRKLRVLEGLEANPYVVKLEPLPPGLHVIYAVTTSGRSREISHPSTVLFQTRSD